MGLGAIPPWTPQGVLPPINGSTPTNADRSPYRVPLTDLILRCATSSDRNAILLGLIRFRAALHATGLVSGFQWIDGSIVERVEVIEGRSPRDVDVVTFFSLPGGRNQKDIHDSAPELFTRACSRAKYHVDSYFVQLTTSEPAALVSTSVYWYSLWAHRRDGLWKGFLQIDLSPAEDDAAQAILDQALHQWG